MIRQTVVSPFLKVSSTPKTHADTMNCMIRIQSLLWLQGFIQDKKDFDPDPMAIQSISLMNNFKFIQGMDTTRLFNREFIDYLNVPDEKRVAEIDRSLGKLQNHLGDTSFMVLINIPAFQLHVVDTQSIQASFKVIVGKTTHQTPELGSYITQVIFNPYWNIPSSILKNEIIPALKKNPDYLKLHHMEWVDGRLRQKPGPWNALGQIKFYFENRQGVYLHDTPQKELFKNRKRTYSHGCIRLEQPMLLLNWILKKEQDLSNVENLYNRKNHVLHLPNEIPIHIMYLSAWIHEGGVLLFFKDVYQLSQNQ